MRELKRYEHKIKLTSPATRGFVESVCKANGRESEACLLYPNGCCPPRGDTEIVIRTTVEDPEQAVKCTRCCEFGYVESVSPVEGGEE